MADEDVAPDTSSGSVIDLIPEDATYGANGSEVSLRDALETAGAPKDAASMVKAYLDTQSELGKRVRIPTDEAGWEQFKTEHGEAAGFTPSVPTDAVEYRTAIEMPAELPEGIEFAPALFEQFAEIGREAGVSPAAMSKLAGLQAQHMTTMVDAVTAQLPGLAITEEELTARAADLQKAYPDDFEERREEALRLMNTLVPPEVEPVISLLGLNNDPRVLKFLMDIAKAGRADSSFVERFGMESQSMTREEAFKETGRAMSDPEHEAHKLYVKARDNGDGEEWQKWQDGIYARIPGAQDKATY